jgi:hypothetical protein
MLEDGNFKGERTMKRYECTRAENFISFSQVDERDPDDNSLHLPGVSFHIPEGMWMCIIEEVKKELEKEQ